jgi:hypothetical protein
MKALFERRHTSQGGAICKAPQFRRVGLRKSAIARLGDFSMMDIDHFREE